MKIHLLLHVLETRLQVVLVTSWHYLIPHPPDEAAILSAVRTIKG
jgi:hypothetical protein